MLTNKLVRRRRDSLERVDSEHLQLPDRSANQLPSKQIIDLTR